MGQWIIDAEGAPSRNAANSPPVERTVFGEGDGYDLTVYAANSAASARCAARTPAAAVEIRHVRAERADPRRQLAEPLIAAAPTRSAPVNNAASPIYAVEGQCFVIALRHGLEGWCKCCAPTT